MTKLTRIFAIAGNGHGWAPEDMFAHNASKHGYKSSFNANLEGYTVQLKVEDTDDYRYILKKFYALVVIQLIVFNLIKQKTRGFCS